VEAVIQFDVFPRDVDVDNEAAVNQVIENPRKIVVETFIETFTGGDELVLCRVPAAIMIHNPECELTVWPVEPSMTLTKSVPEPLDVANDPPPHINPDGSYDYVPEVSGGLGPYDFVIIGMDPGASNLTARPAS
jgi:hypothetical protein